MSNIFDPIIKLYTEDRCILCGSVPDIVGLFIPKNSIEWGGYDKKQRYIRYTLCSFCMKESRYQERVEDKIAVVLKEGLLTQ